MNQNSLDKANADIADATQDHAKSQKESKKQKNKPHRDQNPNITTTEGAANDKLTEKQLRKLEWEKKLSEQKGKAETPDGKESLSKAELKAKRREQQEAQRQAKVEKDKKEEKSKVEKPKPSEPRPARPAEQKTPVKKPIDMKKPKKKHVQLVQHLYREPHPDYANKLVNFKDIHPAFVKLGVQYAEKTIIGSNARCLALLAAIRTLINDLQAPQKHEFFRYTQGILQSCTNYLQECRPFAVSMTNALRTFKQHLRQSIDKETNMSDNEKRAKLIDAIDTYIKNDLRKAWEAISIKVTKKIVDGDVILIYGCSSLIRNILIEANKEGKKFSVIIADNRPLLEGREMLRRLVTAGVKCRYTLIGGLSCVMKHVTKVLLGAHALLTNGSVMSRIGTAQVALVAQAYNKPVLVCCETYKFSERVQTDSFVYNEIDDPSSLCTIDTASTPSPLQAQKDNPKLKILNLLYDVTPPDLVTAVVTELAILPCTSVPVVLRINAGENVPS
ncbi:translation initiation factor eIF-2B subunit delta [Anthonomus grandis grandis]|uniref:translation initiation factor eIF-2B subunit delta n=1 Tax=Anthonomus grandis grandis TaxID=2921223 RepID=UPI0021655EBE|nr:translation initiation factor eIF-2B subunit delta [Anthonomus grandis grandis]